MFEDFAAYSDSAKYSASLAVLALLHAQYADPSAANAANAAIFVSTSLIKVPNAALKPRPRRSAGEAWTSA